MTTPTRLTRPDYFGIAISIVGLGWSLLAVLVLQPSFTKMFADFGAELPALTQAFLKPWLPPVLASVAPIGTGLSIGFNAAPGLRSVAYFASALLTLAQMAAFMIAMYVPIFAIADSIK